MPGWQDMLAPALSAQPGAPPTAPDFPVFRNGIKTWAFDDASLEELWTSVHIIHDWQVGTDLYPHVHWSHTTAPTTPNSTVVWQIEYMTARGYSAEQFPASTTIALEQDVDGAAAYTHHIIEDVGIVLPGASLEIDSLILMRIFRDGGAGSDTLTGDAFLLYVDFHYESDGQLTEQRNAPFTKV